MAAGASSWGRGRCSGATGPSPREPHDSQPPGSLPRATQRDSRRLRRPPWHAAPPKPGSAVGCARHQGRVPRMKMASASRRAAQPGPLVEKMIPDLSPRGPVVGAAYHVNRFRRQLYREQLLAVGKAIVTPIPEIQGRLHPPARLDEAPDPPVLIV